MEWYYLGNHEHLENHPHVIFVHPFCVVELQQVVLSRAVLHSCCKTTAVERNGEMCSKYLFYWLGRKGRGKGDTPVQIMTFSSIGYYNRDNTDIKMPTEMYIWFKKEVLNHFSRLIEYNRVRALCLFSFYKGFFVSCLNFVLMHCMKPVYLLLLRRRVIDSTFRMGFLYVHSILLTVLTSVFLGPLKQMCCK